MAIEPVPQTSLDDLLAQPPHSRGTLINTLWRNGASTIGPLSLLVDAGPEYRLDLLETLRVVAMSETHDADVIAQVLENARSSQPDDGAALHSAATFAITRPDVTRWISANPVHVAASPNWIAALPGLGGAVVSVPLAEEALGHLVAAKADLPRELTRFIQLNPWFTLRFAVQFRRYTGGKRIRLADRAATARAWSHARSLLRSRIPPQWHSRHGRGAGRPLDQWSHRFLVKYSAAVKKAYRGDGIPPCDGGALLDRFRGRRHESAHSAGCSWLAGAPSGHRAGCAQFDRSRSVARREPGSRDQRGDCFALEEVTSTAPKNQLALMAVSWRGAQNRRRSHRDRSANQG